MDKMQLFNCQSLIWNKETQFWYFCSCSFTNWGRLTLNWIKIDTI